MEYENLLWWYQVNRHYNVVLFKISTDITLILMVYLSLFCTISRHSKLHIFENKSPYQRNNFALSLFWWMKNIVWQFSGSFKCGFCFKCEKMFWKLVFLCLFVTISFIPLGVTPGSSPSAARLYIIRHRHLNPGTQKIYATLSRKFKISGHFEN